jgi:predicted patatin/cPLA2 family phospholipase
MDKLRASASLPLVSNIVEVDGVKLLDGGISDSIPIFAFRRMGYRKNIVVLTRPLGYRKKMDKTVQLAAARYKDYPQFVRRIAMRHMYYNKTLDNLEELRQQGQVLIIRPSKTMKIGRLEKNLDKIQDMYNLGIKDAEDKLEEVKKFLSEA